MFHRLSVCFLGLLCFSWLNVHAAEAKKTFDVPAGEALTMLKVAAQQGGVEIMFPAATVQGVRTNAVKGEFAPREALDRMVANTELAVVQDEKSGALTVNRISRPNVQRAAPSGDRPAESPKSEMPGGIRGQVSNGVTRANLENVSIRVRETGRD
jgi:hypothetical protein